MADLNLPASSELADRRHVTFNQFENALEEEPRISPARTNLLQPPLVAVT